MQKTAGKGGGLSDGRAAGVDQKQNNLEHSNTKALHQIGVTTDQNLQRKNSISKKSPLTINADIEHSL